MMEVDGGGRIVDSFIATGAKVVLTGGVLMTAVGVATFNPGAIGAGLGAMTSGADAFCNVVTKYNLIR